MVLVYFVGDVSGNHDQSGLVGDAQEACDPDRGGCKPAPQAAQYQLDSRKQALENRNYKNRKLQELEIQYEG